MKRTVPTHQLGQAFLWFLATLTACCATLMIVYNVGQLATEKEKTTNAADAVAMSGGLVQARGMNLLAYNNRAIIANEMTIAQITSLDAWVKYNDRLTTNLAIGTVLIPGVDEVTAEIAEVMSEIHSAVYELAQIGIRGFQVAVDILEYQRPVLIGLTVLATRDIAQQVAQQNGVDLNDNLKFTSVAATANNLEYWNPVLSQNRFLINHTRSSGPNGTDDRQAANGVIMNSRDEFSANRGPGWLIDGLNWALSLMPFVKGQFVKSSGSAKLRDSDHWEAQDSLDLKAKICAAGWFLCKPLPGSGPIGWGRANVNKDGSIGRNWVSTGDCKKGFGWGSACFLAYFNRDQISQWSGVPEMLDVRHRTGDDSVIKYFVSVKKKGDATMTSQRLGIATVDVAGPQGSPKVEDNLAKDELPAIAAAYVFFKRPKGGPSDPTEGNNRVGHLARKDGIQEYASLYNPYWQARLHTPNCKISNPFSADCDWRFFLYKAQGIDTAVSTTINWTTP